MQYRKPVDLSRLASRKANHSMTRANLSEDSENSLSSKSFDLKKPEVKFKVAHTPNFGKKEEWLPKQKDQSLSSARASSVGTSSRRESSRQYSEVHEPLSTFGRGKAKVPQLPLESLLEESTEQRTLNLSTINYSLELTDKDPIYVAGPDQDVSTDTCYIRSAIEADKGSESEELYDFLGAQEVNGTLLLSPVMQQKAYSRLDESSMVDPLSNILVDKTTETSNKENIRRHSILRRDTEHDSDSHKFKALSKDFETKLLELRRVSKSELSDLKTQLKQVAKEVRSVKAAEIAPERLAQHVQETVREALEAFKQTFLQEKKSELIELVTREIAKHIGSDDLRKNSKVKKEYEDKLRLNQEYIDRLKKQNQTFKAQLDERREPSLDKYRALVSENLKLKEELTSLKHRVQSYSCGRCQEGRRLL